LNGQTYKTLCSCVTDTPAVNHSAVIEALNTEMQVKLVSECPQTPSKLRVRQETYNANLGLSPEILREVLGQPQDFTLLDIESSSFHCIEGRGTDLELGTPGGDFGEFLSALAEYEHVTQRTLSLDDVSQLLSAWLDWGPRGDLPFYYHTDDTSLKHLQAHLHLNGETGKVVGLDVEEPKDELKDQLLKDLTASKNQGCYYIKALLDNPQKFYLRAELTPLLIQALYKIIWNKDTQGSDGVALYTKVNLDILEGKVSRVRKRGSIFVAISIVNMNIRHRDFDPSH
jgi:hypothetical protein